METKFNFKSQICTSRSQSERLLALGLKPETADMAWLRGHEKPVVLSNTFNDKEYGCIPAWSLYRLIEMIPKIIEYHDFVLYHTCVAYVNNDYHIKAGFNGEPFSACIDCIEWLIKEGYFNKEYLD